MNREMDLIRDILLYAEKNCPPENGCYFKFSETEWADDIKVLRAHITLLEKNGFLEEALPSSEDDIAVGQLTWKGHDFVDSVRDPKIWRKTKELAAEAGGYTADIMLDFAKSIVLGALTGLFKGGLSL